MTKTILEVLNLKKIFEHKNGTIELFNKVNLKIKEGDAPRTLLDKRIVSLDLTAMVAGTKYRGQFEERMKAVMNELEKNSDILLINDEINTIVGARG